MKKYFFIYIVTVLSGIASAVVVSSYIAYEAWEALIRSDLTSNKIVHSSSNEFMVRFTLKNIEKLDEDDKHSMYEYNCLILATFTRHINPYSYDNPGRRTELKELKNRSQDLQQRLEADGYCGNP